MVRRTRHTAPAPLHFKKGAPPHILIHTTLPTYPDTRTKMWSLPSTVILCWWWSFTHIVMGTTTPSIAPHPRPSSNPSLAPMRTPSHVPSQNPSYTPSLGPSIHPTIFSPTTSPHKPTSVPTLVGQASPTIQPTTLSPSYKPSHDPTKGPTFRPTKHPTRQPSKPPTRPPSRRPTKRPTRKPSYIPPTHQPTRYPTTHSPTKRPTHAPTRVGMKSPTVHPTFKSPTRFPTHRPTARPSHAPTFSKPSSNPSTSKPSHHPITSIPSHTPSTTIPSQTPSGAPSWNPAYPNPSRAPLHPTHAPTLFPTHIPTTQKPTVAPTLPPRVNVLMIIADDYRALSPSFQQLQIPAITPNIEKLLTRSLRFQNAHTQISICGPSRASFLTSLRPDYLNIFTIDRENALQTRIDHSLQYNGKIMMTIPRLFKSHGYVTYGYGKIPHENEDAMMQDPLTWTVPVFTWKSPYMRPPTFTKPYQGMWINNPDVLDNYFPDGQLGDMAAAQLSALAANPQQPFFIAAGFWKPHLPWSAPLKYFEMQLSVDQFTTAHHGGVPRGLSSSNFHLVRGSGCGEISPYPGGPTDLAGWIATTAQEKSAVQAYYATVTYMDAQVGKLLTALEQSAAANSTVVILMGDHGFHLGDHGTYCKHTNYEQATRTALAIMAPLRDSSFDYTRAKPYVGPVELLDVMPTLADLALLPKYAPNWEVWQGTSLVPVMRNLNKVVKWGAVSQYWRGSGISKKWGYTIRTVSHRYTLWCPAGQQFNMGGRNCFTEMYSYVTDRYEQLCLAGATWLTSYFRKWPVSWIGMLRFNGLRGIQPFDWVDRGAMLHFYNTTVLYP